MRPDRQRNGSRERQPSSVRPMEGFSMGKVIPFRQTIPPAPPERLVDEEVTALKSDWKDYLDLPSLEHRRQIARFCGVPFDDEEDIRQRKYAAFRRWHHAEQLRRQQQGSA